MTNPGAIEQASQHWLAQHVPTTLPADAHRSPAPIQTRNVTSMLAPHSVASSLYPSASVRLQGVPQICRVRASAHDYYYGPSSWRVRQRAPKWPSETFGVIENHRLMIARS